MATSNVEGSGGTTAVSARPNLNPIISLIAAIFVLIILLGVLPNSGNTTVSSRFQTFTTIFLGIFIEAVPFLLAGSLVSGLIAQFVNQDALARYIPRRALPAALVGSMLGFVFPVCECGVVPVTRRLYQKGLPLSVGVAFLLSAPVINPVVIASTYFAFGWGPILIGRFLFSMIIAFVAGLLFHFATPEEILLPPEDSSAESHHEHHEVDGRLQKLGKALVTAGDDFIDMVRYLILGSMLAGLMQTLVPQATLLAFGSGALTSIIAMMALAFVLSICSTVDAFLALSFVSTFTPGSILSFLVFGPMVDIKSALMFLGVFKRRIVLYLILIPLLLTLLLTLFVNLNFSL